MRLAHLADTHLGYRQYYRQTPSGLNQREADVALAFRGVVEALLAERPEVIVVAGDLFHTVRPPNAAIVFAFQQMQRLREALPEAAIILLAGNHDTPRSVETGSIFRLFEAAGIDVATDEARRLVYPHLDLEVLAVPHQALMSPERPVLAPGGAARYQVLALHGEIEGTYPTDRTRADPGAGLLTVTDLGAEAWHYVALGHYHVMHQVAERAWYSGGLDYVTTNPWGERRDEVARHLPGKGWILADLETGVVTPRFLTPIRRVQDLPVIDATDRTPAQVDLLMREQWEALPGGGADDLVRQVVENIPRHVARDLDHAFIRQAKARALHYRLDLRRPIQPGPIGVGPAGRRQALPELFEEYLRRRPLPAELDREAAVTRGLALLARVQDDREET